jgi:hypothetical protein
VRWDVGGEKASSNRSNINHRIVCSESLALVCEERRRTEAVNVHVEPLAVCGGLGFACSKTEHRKSCATALCFQPEKDTNNGIGRGPLKEVTAAAHDVQGR